MKTAIDPMTGKYKQNPSIQHLRRLGVRPGATVYTSITHVSASGMTRHIRVYVVTRYAEKGRGVRHEITDITGHVAAVLGYRRARGSRWDLVVGGCGMDMGFHVVYSLGRAMFPKGGPLAKSNGVRQAQELRSDPKANTERDGGYLLHHKAL